jgi:hypothetical protein
MTRPNFPYEGDETSQILGKYALANREAFRDWLIANEGLSFSQANAISKQAREYYYGDTGTVTARPHRNRVNTYACLQVQANVAPIPVSIGAKETDSIIINNPEKKIRRRLGSGDVDLESPFLYLQEAGLEDIAFVSVEGEYAYAVVGGESL